MDVFKALSIPRAQGICYSGFREGQQPGGSYPSYEEVKEDLLLLQPHWKYLRLYDCDPHAATVLQVIQQEGFDFQVQLGAYIEAEMNNFGCPWGGGEYSEAQLERNALSNERKIQTVADWCNQYSDIIFSASVGNEACVDWTDHYVPVKKVVAYAQQLKAQIRQPITFCENYVPWLTSLQPLAEVVDYISVHTYPVWEHKHIHEALAYTQQNYRAVASMYPNKPVVITEAGWATRANGRGMSVELVSEDNQKIYYNDLMDWCNQEGILVFFFEAFDESWKGSSDPYEPEKHWGVFKIDRSPKKVMQ